jgi:alanine racemase
MFGIDIPPRQRPSLIGGEIGIDDVAAAIRSTGREVLSHLGSRFHRIYYAI